MSEKIITKPELIIVVKNFLMSMGDSQCNMLSDDIIAFRVDVVVQKIENYCNIAGIPEKLKFTVAEIVTSWTGEISEEKKKELNRYKQLYR